MARMDVDIEQIKKLVKLVEKHQLEELTVEEKGFSLTIKGPESAAASVPFVVSPAQSHEMHVQELHIDEVNIEQDLEEDAEPQKDDGLYEIVSPMVGVFYRSSSPDAPSFVEVGDIIEVGQTIGLIEAMKVFSEVPAEVAGEIVEIPAVNGKLVQQGSPLVIIRVKE